MRTTIKKWFFIWDFDREEQWLSACAAKGLALVSVGFCKYEFEETEPGAYYVRLELLENRPNHPESVKYLQFLEETGAEYVGSLRNWVYLRRRTEDGPFDLFSDYASKIAHLSRILWTLFVLMFAEFCCGIGNLMIGWGVKSPFNYSCGGVCMLLGFIVMAGYWKLRRKKKRLEQEKQIYE